MLVILVTLSYLSYRSCSSYLSYTSNVQPFRSGQCLCPAANYFQAQGEKQIETNLISSHTSVSFDIGARYLIGLVMYFTVATGARAIKTFTFLARSLLIENSANAIRVPCECPMYGSNAIFVVFGT